jgi:hydrogenase expression/formation protein HypC
MLTPEANVGDYVLLHTGYAINVINEAEAQETLKILEEMASLSDNA